MVFLRDEARAATRSRRLPRRGPRAARVARGSGRPGGARGRGARVSMPRIEQLLSRPLGLDDDEPSAALPRPAARRAARRAPTSPRSRSAPSPTRRSARPTSSRLLPRPARPGARRPVRDLPPALLDQHRAVVGARPAVPHALPQRRDQHDRGQRQLDAGPRAATSARPTRAAIRCSTRRLRLGDARQRARAARPRRPRRAPRARDARAARPGRATASSTPTCATSTATTRRSSSRGTGRPALVFTDGRVVGAALDRNGLRPLRYAVVRRRPRRLLPPRRARSTSPDGGTVRRGRLGPGQMLVGRSRARRSRRRRAQGAPRAAPALRRAGSPTASRRRDAGGPREPPDEDLDRAPGALRLHARGAGAVLRPIAPHGARADLVDGRRHARCRRSPAARGRSRYFRQRFAQVTNPPIDHLRERLVMSLCARCSARARRSSTRAPRPPRLLELESFFLYPTRLDAARRPRASTRRSSRGRGAAARRAARRRGRGSRSAAAAASLLVDATPGRARAGPDRCSPSAPSTTASSRAGLRTRATLVVETRRGPRGTPLSPACSATAPTRSARGSRSDRRRPGRRATRSAATGPRPPRHSAGSAPAIEDGVLKVMSKMGISDVAATAARRSSTRSASRRGRRRLLRRHAVAGRRRRLRRARGGALARSRPPRRGRAREPRLRQVPQGRRAARDEPRRRRGAARGRAAHALRRPCNGSGRSCYERFAALVNGRAPMELRDLLELVPAGTPGPARRGRARRRDRAALLERRHVARRRSRRRRTRRSRSPSTGSARARTAARAARTRERFRTERNSRIKQIASGRFGVTRRVRGVRRRAPDQDRPGLEARRGRPAARPQGDRRDRPRSGTRSRAWR